MYSRGFIESHTVYVADGAMLCEDCGDERIGELENRREDFRARAMRFIDSGSIAAASEAAHHAAKAESDRAELADGRTLDDGESDSPRSCDSCGDFFDGALTRERTRYVAEAIHEYLTSGRGSSGVVSEWASEYLGAELPALVSGAVRLAILKRFVSVDRARRALERATLFVDRADVRIGRLSGAAAALRDAWVRFEYGGDSVRAAVRS